MSSLIGSFIHTGYCRAKVIRKSELKGYAYIIEFSPSSGDPRGSYKLLGQSAHISEDAFGKIIKNKEELEG